MRKNPEIARLRDVLAYDQTTGLLTWRDRPREEFANARAYGVFCALYRGKPALTCKESTGYLTGRVDYAFVKAHRVCWAIHYGAWPEHLVDHIDGDKTNNRIDNLRPANRKQNAANMRIRPTNLIGLKGVSRARKRFRAQIYVDGRNTNLGHFDTPEEAHARYCEVAAKVWGEYANDGTRCLGVK